jgi:Tol biopolymer transport system component
MRVSEKGKRYPSEKIVRKDPVTGTVLWQMTSYPANHSNIYFTKTSFTPDEQHIVFLSQRNGWTNIYTANIHTGEITQLTDYTDDVGLFSPCITPDGECVYYIIGNTVRKVTLSTAKDETIVKFSGKRPGSMHLSSDGKFLVTRLYPGGAGIKSSIRKVVYDVTHPWRKNGLPMLPRDIWAVSWKSLSRFTAKHRYDIVVIDPHEHTVEKILETDRPGITLISPDNRHILYHMH